MSDLEDPEIDEIETSGENENEVDDGEEEASSGPPRRLTPEEWAEAQDKYEKGIAGLVTLAKEYGVARQTIWKRFKRLKLQRGSRAAELQNAVSAATTQAIAKRVSEYADNREDWAEQTRVEGYKGLRNYDMMARAKIVQQAKAGLPLAALADELKVIERAVKITTMAIQGRFKILNIDAIVDEASLPDLTLRDLTDPEIASIQNQDFVEEDGDELSEADLAANLLADA